MDDRPEAEQTRAVLRNVAAYRHLCQQIRKKANWGLGFGAFMLFIWYELPGREKFGPFGLIYLGLACVEFAAALWNKIRPSAEGVLIDALVLLTFGGANLVRAYLRWQVTGRVDPFYVLIGGYLLFAGISHARSYASLARAFAMRPTGAHLRWFAELLREVRQADPENDPDALDLPTRPPIRGKLLGDSAIFLQAGADLPIIAARQDVEIEREPAKESDKPPTCYLLIEGLDFGRFPLDPENWRNYARWKADDTEPPVVRPTRERE